ncbi:7988_t:CDS:2 [Entrophospora sp. SA101]|nr:7988_t:CDS:2 [Entrophospora sp. SA101]
MFCGIIESTEVHWQFQKIIRGNDFYTGLSYTLMKGGMEVQFWRKDIIEKHSYVVKYGLKPVETYDDEDKKMLEVQKNFMEECEDRNKECSFYMKKSKIFIEEINNLVDGVIEEGELTLNYESHYISLHTKEQFSVLLRLRNNFQNGTGDHRQKFV